MSETPSRPDLPKRFYADVTVSEVDGGHTVLLDARSIKTPLRRPLVLPSRALAERMAAEWASQGERINPATMPVTRLANTVVDGVADDPAPVRAELAGYVETDMLFYRAGYPDRLVARQRLAWDPLVAWAEEILGARFVLAEGVMHMAQSPQAIAAFRMRVDGIASPFAVAALHQMTTLTGSAILALAVSEGRVSLDEGWAAAHVDEDWNAELWGADEEAASRRIARFADMEAAATVVRLLGEPAP